jgi:hypothetical protein
LDAEKRKGKYKIYINNFRSLRSYRGASKTYRSLLFPSKTVYYNTDWLLLLLLFFFFFIKTKKSNYKYKRWKKTYTLLHNLIEVVSKKSHFCILLVSLSHFFQNTLKAFFSNFSFLQAPFQIYICMCVCLKT